MDKNELLDAQCTILDYINTVLYNIIYKQQDLFYFILDLSHPFKYSMFTFDIWHLVPFKNSGEQEIRLD